MSALQEHYIFAYLRASTATQDAARAKQLLEDFATARGLRIASFYIETGSGLSLERPQLMNLIKDAKKGDVLLIESVDRLSRLPQAGWQELKRIISELIELLHGDRIAFIPYAAQAYPQLPLTSDYSAAKIFLEAINTDMLSSQGTAIGEAIQTAINYFEDSNQSSKILIILSNGEDHQQGATEMIQEVKEKGIRIFKRDKDGEVVITKLNQALLEEIAQEGDGKYFDGSNTQQVIDNLQKVLNNIEKNEYESQVFSDYKDQFQWLLAGAFLLLVIDVFISYKKTTWVRTLNLFNEKNKINK